MRHNTPAAEIRAIDEVRRDMYRRQILAGAELEFARSGFGEARMTSIAHAAGVSLSTVYKAFAGKAEVWEAVHEDRMRDLLTYVEQSSRAVNSPLERLLQGAAAVAIFLAEHPAYLELNLKEGFGWGASDIAGVVGGNQRKSWSAGLDMITLGAAEAVRVGELSTVRPRIAAGMIISALQVWLFDWSRAGRDRDPAVVADEMVRYLRQMLTVV